MLCRLTHRRAKQALTSGQPTSCAGTKRRQEHQCEEDCDPRRDRPRDEASDRSAIGICPSPVSPSDPASAQSRDADSQGREYWKVSPQEESHTTDEAEDTPKGDLPEELAGRTHALGFSLRGQEESLSEGEEGRVVPAEPDGVGNGTMRTLAD